jgi:hypothetical protein
MKPLSVIGRSLEEARLVLEEAGLAVVAVSLTGPPGGGSGAPARVPAGTRRVVRQRRARQATGARAGVELVVAASVELAEADDLQV